MKNAYTGSLMERYDYGTGPFTGQDDVSPDDEARIAVNLKDLQARPDGSIRAIDLFDKIYDELKDHAFVFYDTETTGLPHQLPQVQLTQITAIAVGMKGIKPDSENPSGDVFKPEYLGKMHGTAELNIFNLRNLDRSRGGPTIRAILELNRYPLEEYAKSKGVKLPPIPADYKPLSRFNPDKELPEYLDPIDVDFGEFDSGMKPESELLQDFIDFVKSIKSKYGNVVLVAHNARFDRSFISNRCSENLMDCSSLNDCDNLDSQAFMQVYVDPVVKTMQDQTLNSNFKQFLEEKPNRYALDYVNAALGILNKKLSHTSSADAIALVKAVSKLMLLLLKAGNLDIRQPLSSALVSKMTLEDRNRPHYKQKKQKLKRQEGYSFKKKYLLPDDADDDTIKELKRQMVTVKANLNRDPKNEQLAQDLESIQSAIDDHYSLLLSNAEQELRELEDTLGVESSPEWVQSEFNKLNVDIDRLKKILNTRG